MKNKPIVIKGLERYYGGKGSSGTYQAIINHIPPHDVYIEGFLGAGSIMKHKKLARSRNIGIDVNTGIIELWGKSLAHSVNIDVICSSFIGYYLLQITSLPTFPSGKIFIYLDPPYIVETRKQQRNIYKHEMTTQDHKDLLSFIVNIKCNVAISCYPNSLYAEKLADWDCLEYQSMTHAGMVTELLYMNYDKPSTLHDYSFIGSNYRERDRISQKIKRHVKRLQTLPVLERNAILNAFIDNNLIQ